MNEQRPDWSFEVGIGWDKWDSISPLVTVTVVTTLRYLGDTYEQIAQGGNHRRGAADHWSPPDQCPEVVAQW